MALRGEVLARTLKMQEEERARVARDLHDQLGQSLTSVRMGLSMLEHEVRKGAPPEHVADELARLGEQMVGALEEVRGISHNLRPTLLDDVGLEAAVLRHAERWSQESGIPLAVHVNGVDRNLDSEVRTAMYRVMQESLTNIARHAAARSASILLRQADGALRLVVEDDGVGFLVPAEADKGGLGSVGLEGMAERLSLVGGSLVVESSPGHGTTVVAEVKV